MIRLIFMRKIMFLNSKLKQIAGGVCCLTRYECFVGIFYIYKKKENIFNLKVRIATFNSEI